MTPNEIESCPEIPERTKPNHIVINDEISYINVRREDIPKLLISLIEHLQ